MVVSKGGIPTSSYRDRTPELFAIAERLRKTPGAVANGDAQDARPIEKPAAAASALPGGVQSEFNRKASRIGLSIHQTTQKLDKLAKLAKRTSMFDDPAVEIQELTAVIKQDITALNGAIEELQAVCEARESASARNKHTSDHATTVVDSLKDRLMCATKSFKDVLTQRTESLKVHENRRQLFSAASPSSLAGQSALSRQRSLAGGHSSAPPPWAPSTNGVHGGMGSHPFSPSNPTAPSPYAPASPSASQLFNGASSSRRPTEPLKQAQLLQEGTAVQDGFMQTRAEALHNVEATIVELGTIFQNLAVMVQQQGEVAIRIDNDVDETVKNVDGAQMSLLKYFNRMSSNRWLLVKIFMVLLMFLLIFVVFVA